MGLLGGRVAEELVLQDISTGASSDLQRATSIAHSMVSKYGMSEKLGAMVYDSGNNEIFIGKSMAQSRSYSEESAAAIDREVRAIIDVAYQRCRAILEEHRPQLETVAQFLLEHETMSALEFERVFNPDADKALESEALSQFGAAKAPDIQVEERPETPEDEQQDLS